MIVYVMRHGDALLRAKTGADRPLSETGKREANSMVQYLVNAGLGRIMASPYLRAQQTAEIVESGLKQSGVSLTRETLDCITPNNTPMQVIAQLGPQLKQIDRLLLVSHQPLVGSLISLLIEGV